MFLELICSANFISVILFTYRICFGITSVIIFLTMVCQEESGPREARMANMALTQLEMVLCGEPTLRF